MPRRATPILNPERDSPVNLPAATSGRQACHRRKIEIEIFSRPDGMWEVDAEISDTPLRDIVLISGAKAAGEYLHRMQLRLVVDRRSDIIDAGAQTLSAPYSGVCGNHGDLYRRLIGLNLMKGFRQAVKERLGGVIGCTHITELAQVIPTAIVQVTAVELAKERAKENTIEPTEPPFQLDRCHALRRDTDAVRLFYPRWYRGTKPISDEAPPK